MGIDEMNRILNLAQRPMKPGSAIEDIDGGSISSAVDCVWDAAEEHDCPDIAKRAERLFNQLTGRD